MYKDIYFNLEHTKLAAKAIQNKENALNVMMLHGWLDNAASFDAISPLLHPFNITSLDLAGHGLSDHRPAGSFYHLWDYALDVIAVLNMFALPIWLVGHSMGGAVAMLVAAIAPEKVQGLIILDNIGPATAMPKQRVATMKRAVQKMLKQPVMLKMRPKTKDELIHSRMNGFTPLTYEAAKILVERGAISDGEEWSWRSDTKLHFPSPFRMDEESVAAFIENIACPTLLLMANDGLYAGLDKDIANKAKLNPCIKLKWLSGSHHFHLETETCQHVASEIKHFIECHQ